MGGYRIESDGQLSSDWLPASAFTTVYGSVATAIPIAIEGVEDPGTTEVRIVDAATDQVVWRSTNEACE